MSMVNNSIHLIGHLGQNPEIRTSKNGKSVAWTSLATNSGFKNKKGEWETKTQWHKLVAWNNQAEVMEKYLKKGSRIAVVGYLDYNQYEDKNGVKRTNAQIVVNSFQMLDKKEKS